MLSAAILLLIVLPLLFLLLLEIPAVQNYVAHKAADFASEKLETRVSIDRIGIGLPNKVRLYGFYVEDYQRDTLLYAGEVRTSLSGLGLFGGGVSLSGGKLDNVKFFLKETPDSVMNIKPIIERLSRRDGKGNFRLSLSGAEISNLELRIERLDHRNPEYGVDYGNMRVENFNGRIESLSIAASNIKGRVSGISFREQSGFELRSMDGSFEVDRGYIRLTDARFRTEESDICFDSLSLTGGEWPNYKDFIHNVAMSAAVRNTTLSSNDIGYFAPGMRNWGVTVSDLDMTAQGRVDSLGGHISRSVVNDRTELAADITIEGLPDYRTSKFDIALKQLRTDGDDARSIAGGIVPSLELPESVTAILNRAGTMALSGGFAGRLSSFRTDGVLVTDAGAVRFDADMRPKSKGVNALRARVATRQLNLGRLLGAGMLGDSRFMVRADGSFGGGEYDFDVDGRIPQMVVGGFACDSIMVKGHAANGDISGIELTVRDSALDLDVRGDVALHGGEDQRYNITAALRNADLHAMGINTRDSLSVLTIRQIDVDVSGSIPDDVDGSVVIADASYRYNESEISSNELRIDAYRGAENVIALESEYLDMKLTKRNSYKDLITYVKELVGTYMPLLYDRDGNEAFAALEHHDEGGEDDYHNSSELSIRTKNFEPVAGAIWNGMEIADGSWVNVMLDPVCNIFRLKANSDYLQRGAGMLITALDIDASNESDSLVMDMKAQDFYIRALQIPSLRLHGSARDNRITLNGNFADTLQEFSGRLGIEATLRRDSLTRRRGVDVDILAPSFLKNKGNRWNITSGRIAADSSRIDVDHFAIRNTRQELEIDGVASPDRNDSLTITMRDFDLSPLTQLVSSLGYSLEGRTNGRATIESALKNSRIAADIRIDSLYISSIPVKPLEFVSTWDFEQNRARITLRTAEDRKTLIRGFYVPSEVRYMATLKADSIDMALLDPLLSGVISNTRGVAEADLTLSGERREATLKGDIKVRNLSTKLDYTQVTYSVPEARIEVDNNLFKVSPVRVFDPEGHSGELKFDLNLNHLSNIGYQLDVFPEKMLVLNTTPNDNDYFYGKVYASGSARIKGDKQGVKMDFKVESENNSEFNMPLSGRYNASMADFVTFRTKGRPDSVSIVDIKKMEYERRQNQKVSASSNMDITMNLNVHPNTMCQLVFDPTVGDIIKGRGEGSLSLEINPSKNILDMHGVYTITEGSYLFTLQNIINKKFIIDEGSTVQWTGDPMDAQLNIDAVYKVKASLQPLLVGSVSSSNVPSHSVPVECVIHIKDRLTNPTVTFDVEVPNADPDVQSLIANALTTPESRSQQFLYLLVANSFISEASSNMSGAMGATASAATGFELLSNQLSNWLSADDYNIVIRYRPKTDMTSDEVDIGFSTELVSNRLLLEVEGNYLVDRSMSVNQTSNIMGEAYLTWLIDRAGNLRLKGFTHTIDRFDENQGLQETGIGIYYKESFDNLKDLKQRVKERFSSEKRRKRREERRLRREQERGEAGRSPGDDESSSPEDVVN